MPKNVKRSKEILDLLSSGMIADVVSYRKNSSADAILLNDGETYIALEEQDYHAYHDCSASARHVEVRKDKAQWNRYKNEYYPASDLI